MRGRKPKPTGLKQVLANPGHRDLNTAEPKPTGIAARPKFLKGRAVKIWEQYAPELERLGVLTSVDSHTFAAWCALAAEFERSPKDMTASRIAQMRALGSSFGLDASARARLSVKDAEKNADPAEKYFVTTGPGNTLRQ